MAYTTINFSRSSGGYNAEDGDKLDFDMNAVTIGSSYKCTSFYCSITGGITSATTSARTHDMKLQLKSNGDWRTIWEGSKSLPKKGTTGYNITFSGSIPSNYQTMFATYGIEDICLRQDGDYALRGANATGYIEITYETAVTKCSAPTSVTLNGSSSALSTTASTATLAWSGAGGGTNNSISGYVVLYSDSSNGSSWGSWYSYGEKDVSSTASSYSMSVNLASAGTYRKFKVSTFGTAGKDYMSGYKESPSAYRQAITACSWSNSATCSVNTTLATNNVTLSWSGAQSGTGNSISKYEIQRYEYNSSGTKVADWTGVTTTTSTSLSVAIPSTPGNYYKFRVRIQGSAGSSYYSGWKESSNAVRRDHAALAGFSDSTLTAGSTPVKAIHMTELQDRTNTLRTFYGLSNYGFSTIASGSTSLGSWTTHVNQIRTAIDEVCNASGKSHGTWISFSVNCPRADVIEQLRSVILAL